MPISYISLLIDCKEDEWTCDYGQCIPLSQRCNINIDCPEDASDERNCDCKFQFAFWYTRTMCVWCVLHEDFWLCMKERNFIGITTNIFASNYV